MVVLLYEEKKIVFLQDIEKLKELSDLKILTEENFFDFQNIIREIMGDSKIEPFSKDDDVRVLKIKAKARLREKVKRNQKNTNGISLTTLMSALCCMGIGITPLNIGEISYACASFLVKTYQEKEKYEVDIRFLAGGADPKKLNPSYWIKNLD